jgi:two-component system, NtrC family, nitrogen regulation sensor histidine kinase NtrY
MSVFGLGKRTAGLSPLSRRWWSDLTRSRYLLGGGYMLAFALTATAVALASSPPATGPLGPASSVILAILGFNLVLILSLAALVGWRVVGMLGGSPDEAGARLHLRFVALFSMAAVAPALIVALFFGVLVNRGVESWFSQRVRTVVENSATVARSYVEEQKNYISDHMLLMAQAVNSAAPAIAQSPVAFGHFLASETADNGFSAAYVLDRDGRVLARGEASPVAFLAPPPTSFAAADEGDISAQPFEGSDLFRALYKLRAIEDGYLYIVRPVDPGILNHLRETEASLVSYRDAAASRTRIQAAFILSYIETALLVLVGAVWLGVAAANSIAAPVARLVQAAGRVAQGDLDARVDSEEGPAEIAVLTRAFNQMTSDLQGQQAALKAASVDAEARRQFIETVLSGVSAGVMGLDEKGRISAFNRSAANLLGLSVNQALGKPLEKAAPELAGVMQQAMAAGSDAEAEVDIVRKAETRRLRVRASGHSAEGLVLTFDDITRLVTAQRNAAWRDVARRIAHEIKNPLTPIQLSAERLKRKYRKEIVGDLETFDRCVETIVRQVGDIGRMVDEFSSFARMPAPKFAQADAAELIQQAVFAQRVATPEIEIDTQALPATFPIMCDARMIGQALANLLKNAAEAIAGRRAEEADAPEGRIRAALTQDRSGAVSLSVEDNGIGLPVRDRDRLTEPYVTTREKGTGLGLAIVKRIMEDHGGELLMADAPQARGAVVTLKFAESSVPQDAPQTTQPLAVPAAAS